MTTPSGTSYRPIVDTHWHPIGPKLAARTCGFAVGAVPAPPATLRGERIRKRHLGRLLRNLVALITLTPSCRRPSHFGKVVIRCS